MITGKLDKTQDLFGLSTDSKPTDVSNGSVFTEMDTLLKYIFKDNYWEIITEGYTGEETAYDSKTEYFPGDICTNGANTPTYYKCRAVCKGKSPLVATNVGYGWLPLL